MIPLILEVGSEVQLLKMLCHWATIRVPGWWVTSVQPWCHIVTLQSCCFLVISCVWLFGDPIGQSPPDSSVHGISQTRILEWVAISFFRGSSWPRDQTWITSIAGRFFTSEPPRIFNLISGDLNLVWFCLCHELNLQFGKPFNLSGSGSAFVNLGEGIHKMVPNLKS